MAEPNPNGCLSIIGAILSLISGGLAWFLLIPHGPPSDFQQPDAQTPAVAVTAAAIAPEPLAWMITLAPVDEATPEQLDAAQRVISQRLVALGVPYSEVTGADGTISVQLSSADLSLEEISAALRAVGLLEFVDFSGVPDFATYEGMIIQTSGHSAASAALNPVTNAPFETVLTGVEIAGAQANLSAMTGQWEIALEFSEAGAEILGAFTEAHIGQPMAIVLDGRVLSLPMIQARIDTGAVIQGNFTEAEVRALVAQLQTQPLPVALQVASMGILEP